MMKRFGGQRIRMYLAVLSMVLYIFTKISVSFLISTFASLSHTISHCIRSKR